MKKQILEPGIGLPAISTWKMSFIYLGFLGLDFAGAGLSGGESSSLSTFSLKHTDVDVTLTNSNTLIV